MRNKLHIASNFTIDANEYANQANAILGIKKAGKSWTAMLAAEQLMDCGIPIIAFDPIGIWKSLKIGIGDNSGYPIVVAGGEGSDIILTEDNVEDIVRAAMKENVSLVIDLYSRELANKSTWIRIVEKAVRLLLYENEPYGIRHIFLEEGSEFIPQRVQPQHGKVYAEIEKLVRMGRNVGLGITVINQRAEEINKAILELCDLSFLHKQVGKNSLLSIQKWFEVRQIERAKEIIKSIPLLERGECWIVGNEHPFKIKVANRKTFHPDPNNKNEIIKMSYLKVDVREFVFKIKKQLEKSKTVTPEINSLANKDGNQNEAILQGMLDDTRELLKETEVQRDNFKSDADRYKSLWLDLQNKLSSIHDMSIVTKEDVQLNNEQEGYFKTRTNIPFKPLVRELKLIRESNGDLPYGEKLILIACAQLGKSITRNHISILTGYTQSSRDTYIGKLKEKGLLEQDGTKLITTDVGKKMIGSDYKRLPVKMQLQQYWLGKLSQGEAKILKACIDKYPKETTRQEISEITGYTQSSRDTYIGKMARKELIQLAGPGKVKCTEYLFI